MPEKGKKLLLHFKGQAWNMGSEIPDVHISKFKGEESCTLLVKLKSQKLGHLESIQSDHGLLGYRKVSGMDNVFEFKFSKMSIQELTALAALYYKTGLIEYAEPKIVQKFRPQSPAALNDPLFSQQWILNNTGQNGGTPGMDPGILKAIDWIKSQNVALEENIKIAVLDEGVDIDHQDLSQPGLMQNGFSRFGNPANPKPKDHDHHGTQIAGIIASVWNNLLGIAGANPFCKIMPGRIYYHPNGVRPTEMAKGIRQAADLGARVLNLSWKIVPSPMIADAIQYAVSKNCIVCAAAGNYLHPNDDRSVQFPGKLDDVIAVGAYDHRGEWINLNNAPAAHRFGSCHGRELDISAPGLYVHTLKNKNTYDPAFFGTSAATAIVSAIAGLVIAVRPDLSANDIKTILYTTADQVPLSEGTSLYISERYGHGRINALEAVKMAHLWPN
jgi:subtilisin family serine protease